MITIITILIIIIIIDYKKLYYCALCVTFYVHDYIMPRSRRRYIIIYTTQYTWNMGFKHYHRQENPRFRFTRGFI